MCNVPTWEAFSLALIGMPFPDEWNLFLSTALILSLSTRTYGLGSVLRWEKGMSLLPPKKTSVYLYQCISWSVDLWKDLEVIISMMLMCNAKAVVEYDGRRSRLSNAPLDMDWKQLYRVLAVALIMNVLPFMCRAITQFRELQVLAQYFPLFTPLSIVWIPSSVLYFRINESHLYIYMFYMFKRG